MARAIPPLPDPHVREFPEDAALPDELPVMDPVWVEFWVKLLGAVGDLNTLTAVFPLLPNFATDAAAAAGGIAIGQLYRNASAVQVRVT